MREEKAKDKVNYWCEGEILNKKRWINRRWLTIPLSFFNTFALIALIVVPMSSVDYYPQVKIESIRIISPPDTPGVPPAGKPSKTVKKLKSIIEERKSVQSGKNYSRKLVLPVKLPEKIEEQNDLLDWNKLESGEEIFGVEGGDPQVTAEVQEVWSKQFEGLEINLGKPQFTVRQPKKLKEVAPLYPEVARMIRVEGDVVIEATTDIYGRVNSLRVISGHQLLAEAAKAAVSQWLFEPYLINGIPKPVKFVVIVNFRLEK